MMGVKIMMKHFLRILTFIILPIALPNKLFSMEMEEEFEVVIKDTVSDRVYEFTQALEPVLKRINAEVEPGWFGWLSKPLEQWEVDNIIKDIQQKTDALLDAMNDMAAYKIEGFKIDKAQQIVEQYLTHLNLKKETSTRIETLQRLFDKIDLKLKNATQEIEKTLFALGQAPSYEKQEEMITKAQQLLQDPSLWAAPIKELIFKLTSMLKIVQTGFDSMSEVLKEEAKTQPTILLLEAALENNNKLVKHLVSKAGININAKDQFGYTVLHMIALRKTNNDTKLQQKLIAAAQILIANGADVNIENKIGLTPLKSAINAKNTVLVKLLLDKGAKVNVASGLAKETPLHTAVRTGNIEIIKLLLNKGADIHKQNEADETPLSLAKKLGNTAVVELLQKYEKKAR